MKFAWVTLNVSDMKKSLDFYEGVVGLKTNRRMGPEKGREIVFLGFDDSSTQVELICSQNVKPEHGQDLSLGFEVKSLAEKTEFLEKAGYKVDGPYQPAPHIKFSYVKDPDGVKIQFFENF